MEVVWNLVEEDVEPYIHIYYVYMNVFYMVKTATDFGSEGVRLGFFTFLVSRGRTSCR